MKKNVLVIFTDQQRYDTFAAAGNEHISVPNLNRLAKESTVFQQAYVTQPLCTPSRGSIMTGLYPHRHGAIGNNIPLGENGKTLAEYVKDTNCNTGYIGKWHLGNEIYAQRGFDEWISIDDRYREYISPDKDTTAHCSYYHFLREHGFLPDDMEAGYAFFSREFCTRLPERYSKPAFIAQEAQRFIRSHRENPFVLYVNFFEPHSPYHSPYDEFYDPSDITLPPCFDQVISSDVPLNIHYKSQSQLEVSGLNTEEEWRKLIARYWGMITLVDKQLGLILDTLKDCGLEEDTIVVFTSDHGDLMGDFRMLGKGLMYQSSVRVPLMIKVPGESSTQRHICEPVSLVDLLPTLLDIAGLPADSDIDGRSLFPAMKGETHLQGNNVFIEWNLPASKTNKANLSQINEVRADEESYNRSLNAAVRTIVTSDGWKMNLNSAGECELYDLNTDPLETKNLYYLGLHQDRINMLRDEIRNWQIKTNDQVLL